MQAAPSGEAPAAAEGPMVDAAASPEAEARACLDLWDAEDALPAAPDYDVFAAALRHAHSAVRALQSGWGVVAACPPAEAEAAGGAGAGALAPAQRALLGEALACVARSTLRAQTRSSPTTDALSYAALALRWSPAQPCARLVQAQLYAADDFHALSRAHAQLCLASLGGDEQGSRAAARLRAEAAAVIAAANAAIAECVERNVKQPMRGKEHEALLASPVHQVVANARSPAAGAASPSVKESAQSRDKKSSAEAKKASAIYKALTCEAAAEDSAAPLMRQFDACAADELTLRVLTWNLRASLELHVPIAKTLEAKVSNLAALAAQHGASLCALQECPGEKLAAGARRLDDDGECEAKAALPPMRQLVQRCPQLRGWDYAEAQTRGEAAGFAYDTGVLQLLHGPVAYYAPKPADEDKTGAAAFEFQRPPVLAVFARRDDTPVCARAAPLGLLAVVSVHLKAYDAATKSEKTRAELEHLGCDAFQHWLESCIDAAAAHAGSPSSSDGPRTRLILGDFNLAYAVGGDMPPGPYAQAAWDALQAPRGGAPGFRVLLPPRQVTNFDTLVKEAACYDNALLRHSGGVPLLRARAFVVQVLADELEDAAAMQAALQGAAAPRTELLREFVAMLPTLLAQKLVYKRWSDHKPVCVELTCDIAARVPGSSASPIESSAVVPPVVYPAVPVDALPSAEITVLPGAAATLRVSCSAGDAVLELPMGSVTKPTRVCLAVRLARFDGDAHTRGPLVALLPHGLRLCKRATLRIFAPDINGDTEPLALLHHPGILGPDDDQLALTFAPSAHDTLIGTFKDAASSTMVLQCEVDRFSLKVAAIASTGSAVLTLLVTLAVQSAVRRYDRVSGNTGGASAPVTPLTAMLSYQDPVLCRLPAPRRDYDVMLSYRVHESGEHGDGSAFELQSRLEALNIRTFLGEKHILPGANWPKLLQKVIEDVAAVVVVLSPTYGNTTWTAREIAYADSLGKPLVPVWHSGPWPPNHVGIYVADTQRVPLNVEQGFGAAGTPSGEVLEVVAGQTHMALLQTFSELGYPI